uniref:E3 ubiquitin-protein ligase UBR5 n=1 Tax=Ditylenchus dipsaci TaxID=166011 RepID=A0A915EF78_9BILA
MSDDKQLFLFGQALPGSTSDVALVERIQECANYRNKHGGQPTKALENIPADHILQTAVGHNHIAFLFKDHRVARLSFEVVQNKVETCLSTEKPCAAVSNSSLTSVSTAIASDINPSDVASSSVVSQPSASSASTPAGSTAASVQVIAASYAAAAATAAANRTAKIRRVMMAARTRPGGFCGRTGVIVDRARPLVPVTSIPEELIAQAQVVLQGKTRDVIVRELQRTNLNVNEAVNNLLSRDDDEGDDLDNETSEAYLHEELLSLLDAGLRSDGAGAAIIDHDNVYASTEGYEYLVSRDIARRREDVKSKDRSKDSGENSSVVTDQLAFGDALEYWPEFPQGVEKFIKISAMHSDLFALADDGRLYSWNWGRNKKPSNSPHHVNSRLIDASKTDTTQLSEQPEKIIDIESCAWRSVVLTNQLRIGSFMDAACGAKIFDTFFEGLVDIPDGEAVEKLHVSPLFSAVQTTNNCLFWRGIYPFNERRKIFEKCRNKSRKHVTFDTTEIVEGSEVRTKSMPIYSAGSVAINFSGGVPMIGTLMEAAWTLNETCRFRVTTPEQYDTSVEEKPEDRKVSFNHEGSSSLSGASVSNIAIPPPSLVKETAWSLREVIFIKEENSQNDTGIVKIVDGAYCGIVYKSSLQKQTNDSVAPGDLSKIGLRLLRKDDLVVVPQNGQTLRSPENFQSKLQALQLPLSVRKIIAMAIDSNGFRVLVEKKNRVHLLRLSCLGKLFSDHIMPFSLSDLCVGDRKPSLENYGDESTLFLRAILYWSGKVHDLGIGIRYLKNSDEINNTTLSSSPPLSAPPQGKQSAAKNVNRFLLLAVLVAPNPATITPEIPSLMQSILYCDLQSVRSILNQLESSGSAETKRAMIVDDKVDGNRNIFHVAVMNAFSKTNRDQADVDSDDHSFRTSLLLDTAEAEAARSKFDRKWQEMVTTPGSKPIKAAKETPEERKADDTTLPSTKERQRLAIEITRELAKHPLIRSFTSELMKERDNNGYTPFVAAVQNRAYTAASLLWAMIEEYADTSMNLSMDVDDSSITDAIMPYGSRPDDSPIFILCYNDTCSFTWTGDEHVNQDIFECKTCGLTGTLCCCTECAFTCHRNHDCKLKRTSPTAYCDCWEKCACKALVVGNTVQRELLLSNLLNRTSLISRLNSRGDHLLLFLARTVGRQLVEQENFNRRISKLRSSHQQPPNGNQTPEHDLEPPKFAKRALNLVLSKWSAVKSLLQVGVKSTSEDALFVEEIFHLGEQSGSSHLDKFVFCLLVRCPETHLDVLLNTLISQANLQTDRDPEIDVLICRFVRSVIRIFSLIVIISPSAASMMQSAIASCLNFNSDPATAYRFSSSTSTTGQTTKQSMPNYRTVAISGMLSLVRASLPASLNTSSGKESKKKTLNNFMMKSRRVFQALVTYSITELLNASEAIVSPLVIGMVKPSIYSPSQSGDVLDVVEKYLNSEQDLTTLLSNNEDASVFGKNSMRKRNGSQRENDENNTDVNNSNQNAVASDRNLGEDSSSDSDQDSENDEDQTQSRRLNSVGAADDAATSSQVSVSTKRKDGRQEHREDRKAVRTSNTRRDEYGTILDLGDSTDNSLSSPSEDDDDDENSDESSGEYENGDRGFSRARERIGHLDGAEEDRDEDEDDEDDHEIDDEEEDPYFENENMEDDGEDESNSEANEAALANGGDSNSNDTAPAGQDEISVEMMETNESVSETAANSESRTSDVYVPLSAISVDNAEGGAGNAQLSRSSRTSGAGASSSASAYGSALNWAVSRVRQESESGNLAESEVQQIDPNAGTASSVAATTGTSQGTSIGGGGASRLRFKEGAVTSDDTNANMGNNTGMQLAMVFSVLLKLVDELMLELIHYREFVKNTQKGISTLLALDDDRLVGAFRQLIENRLQPTWDWLHLIMDRTEAKLKFGNALSSSSVGHLINAMDIEKSQAPEISKERRYKKKLESSAMKRIDDHSTQNAGSQLCSYFLSLLRSHSSEAGDDLPIIEFNSLKSVAFVVEAYLHHINLLDDLNNISLPKEVKAIVPKEPETAPVQGSKNLRKFYQRSKSICYPFISTADSHHAFKYAAKECLPLSAKSNLLQPEVERSQLFALPIPHRTKSSHREIALEHGVQYPTHQSFARPPLNFKEVLGELTSEGQQPNLLERPNVIVHSSQASTATEAKYQGDFGIESLMGDRTSVSRVQLQKILGRWSNVTLFLSKAFHTEITSFCNGDASLSVLLSETAGYHVRHTQFRQRMEKFKAIQSKDLVFSSMSREKSSLFSQTVRQLNQQYIRRIASASSSSHQTSMETGANPPLASHKVKVTFRDEPGEGTGVARSFYSAVADCFLNIQSLPIESLGNVIEDGTSLTDDGMVDSRRPPSSPTRNLFSRMSKRSSQNQTLRQAGTSAITSADGGSQANTSELDRVATRSSTRKASSTLPPAGSNTSSSSRRSSHRSSKNTDEVAKTSDGSESTKKVEPTATKSIKDLDAESHPLFYKTSKSGYYTPIAGSNSSTRLNAFRNCGRLIGICLQHMEILPMHLCRHVLKFVLNRPITWFDLAFFDPSLFDSLRSIVYNDVEDTSHNNDFYESLQLTFAVDLPMEEGGGMLELKPGGANIAVTKENVLEYIYLFVEHRLLGSHLPCLEAIRRGVFVGFDDILSDYLDGLTSEDLRLILCGNQEISVPLLESYTKFSDESSAAAEVLAKYKQWFWSVVSKFTAVEKQDLVFFWTGSPSLPSTEEGFQPLPTIMIRPADDLHLPTANTCISRLYVPLYSTKKILRSKLLLAIKARNFGFV